MSCLSATDFKQPKQIQIANYRSDEGLRIREDGSGQPVIKINANFGNKRLDETLNSKEVPKEDSINFSNPNSETRRGRVGKKVSQTLETQCNQGIYTQQRIRRLTPLECFRLMDFNENFKWNVSDSQAYKQAGNSICVGVLTAIIEKLNL